MGVEEGGGFEVLDWRAASAETTEDYEELLMRLWKRGLETVELIVSAAQTVYPGARHQRSMAHWFRNADATIGLVGKAEIPAGVLVDLGRGKRSAGAAMGTAILCALAVVGTGNLGEGWLKHLRRYLSRFPRCRNAEHSEQVLGCFLLAAEQKMLNSAPENAP